MNDREWKNLNEHIKNKFSYKEKIEILKKFPNISFMKHMQDNKIYKVPFVCISISIIDSEKYINKLGQEIWSKIISELAFCITKIMKIYRVQYLKIEGDIIFGIFQSYQKKDIDKIVECCLELNTFKLHINKQINKFLSKKITKNDLMINYGIGAWFSLDNFLSKIGNGKYRDTFFIGSAVNYSILLSKIASRKNEPAILFNQTLYENLSNKYKNNICLINSNKIKEQNIYGCNFIMNKYVKWIRNDI